MIYNEAALADGVWHPEWRKQRAGDAFSLYNRMPDPIRHAYSAVLKYLVKNRSQVPAFQLPFLAWSAVRSRPASPDGH